MLTKTIEIKSTQSQFKELLAQVAQGVEIILTEDDKPIARLLPMGQRVAGLHNGAIQTSEDFDEPLSDDFWTSRR